MPYWEISRQLGGNILEGWQSAEESDEDEEREYENKCQNGCKGAHGGRDSELVVLYQLT